MADILKKAFDESISSLKHKNDVRKNIMEVSGDLHETFHIGVETPEVLMLKMQWNWRIKLSLPLLLASGARVEGTVIHLRAPKREVVYQRSYRSDKGYENCFDVRSGDVLSIAMEAPRSGVRRGQNSNIVEIVLKRLSQ